MTSPTIEEQACGMVGTILADCIRQRITAGVAKYGQRLDDNHQPDRAKAVHLIQEELDALQYALWLGDTRKANKHAHEATLTLIRYSLTAEEIMQGGKH